MELKPYEHDGRTFQARTHEAQDSVVVHIEGYRVNGHLIEVLDIFRYGSDPDEIDVNVSYISKDLIHHIAVMIAKEGDPYEQQLARAKEQLRAKYTQAPEAGAQE